MNKEKIQQYLKLINKCYEKICQELNITLDELEDKESSNPIRYDIIEHVINNPQWPQAVETISLGYWNRIKDRKKRAKTIIEQYIGASLHNKTFLDFGCGTGDVAEQSTRYGTKKSYGFDINYHTGWNEQNNLVFTHDISELPKNYFDIILLYDVIDHVKQPQTVINQLKELVKENGLIFVRCHPWTSRSGGHLHYNFINKAYAHLFLTNCELNCICKNKLVFTRKEYQPLSWYRNLFYNNFVVQKEKIIKEKVESWFYQDLQIHLLQEQTMVSDVYELLKTMEIKYVDYILEKD